MMRCDAVAAKPCGARRTVRLLAVAALGLATACSGPPARAPSDPAGSASASDEMGEAHDQSAFGKDPSETHLMSPDEPDLHPQPEPAPVEPR